jgi:hypothetical protein
MALHTAEPQVQTIDSYMFQIFHCFGYFGRLRHLRHIDRTSLSTRKSSCDFWYNGKSHILHFLVRVCCQIVYHHGKSKIPTLVLWKIAVFGFYSRLGWSICNHAIFRREVYWKRFAYTYLFENLSTGSHIKDEWVHESSRCSSKSSLLQSADHVAECLCWIVHGIVYRYSNVSSSTERPQLWW